MGNTAEKDLIQSFLKEKAFIKFHVDTARMLGGNNNDSILLQFLIDRDNYYNTDDGWFFLTEDQREQSTNITAYQQREVLKRLKQKEIVEVKRKGIPAKTWFKIDYENYSSQLSTYLKSSCEETKQLDDKKLDNYLIDNNKLDKSNNTSKEVKGDSPPKVFKTPFLLEEWRTKEQIPKKQHHPKEGTKIHKRIKFLTTLFLKGKFGAHCDLDPKFLASCNLTKKQTNRKFSEDELLAGLDEMAEMFKLNNLPEDKTAISNMSFDSLIYHPIAKISYLLKYMYTDTKPLEYKTVQVYEHWLDKLYDERIFDKAIENDHHQFGILKKGLAGIEEYYAWMEKNIINGLPAYSRINTEDKFFNVYVDWIDEYAAIVENPYNVGPNSKGWGRFIKWLEEAIHGDFKHRYPTLNRNNYGK